MDGDVLRPSAHISVQDLKFGSMPVRGDWIIFVASQAAWIAAVGVQRPIRVLPAVDDHRVDRVTVERAAHDPVFLEGDKPGLLVRPGDRAGKQFRLGRVRIVGKLYGRNTDDQPYPDQR